MLFRGPSIFLKNDFKYVNKVKGVVGRFEGEETIFFKDKLVYQLNYHGGFVTIKNN